MSNGEGFLLALAVLALIVLIILGYLVGKLGADKSRLNAFAEAYGWKNDTAQGKSHPDVEQYVLKKSDTSTKRSLDKAKKNIKYILVGDINDRTVRLVGVRQKIGTFEHPVNSFENYVIIELKDDAPFFFVSSTFSEESLPNTVDTGDADFDARHPAMSDDNEFAQAVLNSQNRELISNTLGKFDLILIENRVLVGLIADEHPPEGLVVHAEQLITLLGNIHDTRFRF